MAFGPVTRGHIACFTNIPPLLYHFQFNPTDVTISKSVTYDSEGLAKSKSDSLLSAASRGAYLQEFNKDGMLSLGGSFLSTAEAKRFSKEGDRTLSFKLFIDGTEPGPRERPTMRSADRMHINDDLALLETFLYPAPGNAVDVGMAGFRAVKNKALNSNDWASIWYSQPPVASVSLGDISFDGFVTDMKINIMQWNAALEPIRATVDMTVVEKPDALGTMINHAKRQFRMARGLLAQYDTFDFEEDVF